MPIILKNNKIIFNQNYKLSWNVKFASQNNFWKVQIRNAIHPTISFFFIIFQINSIIRHLKANLNISTTKFILLKKTIIFTVTSSYFAGRENLQPFYYIFLISKSIVRKICSFIVEWHLPLGFLKHLFKGKHDVTIWS